MCSAFVAFIIAAVKLYTSAIPIGLQTTVLHSFVAEIYIYI